MKVMTAKKAPKPLTDYSSAEWAMEPKLDGFRATIRRNADGSVEILSRTSKSQAGKVPHIEVAITAADRLGVDSTTFVIDGEMMWLDTVTEVGACRAPLGDFNKTMRVMGSGAAKAVAKQEEFGGTRMVFFAFDVLESNGRDTTSLTWEERRNILTDIVVTDIASPYIGLTPVCPPSQETYNAYVDAGGEGMMLKKRNSPYQQRRSSFLLKVKAEAFIDAVVMGFTKGEGKYSDTVGAIVFGQYTPAGDLVKVGQCSGFDEATRYGLGEHNIGQVIEVKHYGMVTEANLEGLRHPTWMRFRDDKEASDCRTDENHG